MVVRAAGTEQKTPTINNDLNPIWKVGDGDWKLGVEPGQILRIRIIMIMIVLIMMMTIVASVDIAIVIMSMYVFIYSTYSCIHVFIN